MNARLSFILCLILIATATYAEKISLVGATVINPADGKVLPNATVVVNGDKIERVAMGRQDAATLGKQISCVGKFILPGYIDTHVHFFQSAFARTKTKSHGSNRISTTSSLVTFAVASPAWLMSAARCGISRSAKRPMQRQKRRE